MCALSFDIAFLAANVLYLALDCESEGAAPSSRERKRLSDGICWLTLLSIDPKKVSVVVLLMLFVVLCPFASGLS